MVLKKLFPYTLAACFALSLLPATAAQTAETRGRLAAQKTETLILSAIDDPVIISLASAEEMKPVKELENKSGIDSQFRQLISAAIGERLGARYSWGATGPSAFDCSGFVWSTFKSAGVDFERGSARTLWDRFSAPTPEEKFKFGTLVFFNGMAHIGIVADEHGFYHASRHHGVVYSPFNEYWTSRIDGFRKVPMMAPLTTD